MWEKLVDFQNKFQLYTFKTADENRHPFKLFRNNFLQKETPNVVEGCKILCRFYALLALEQTLCEIGTKHNYVINEIALAKCRVVVSGPFNNLFTE